MNPKGNKRNINLTEEKKIIYDIKRIHHFKGTKEISLFGKDDILKEYTGCATTGDRNLRSRYLYWFNFQIKGSGVREHTGGESKIAKELMYYPEFYSFFNVPNRHDGREKNFKKENTMLRCKFVV